MRKIFNEYGGWVIVVFVIIALLLLVGGIKSIDGNGKVKGTGLTSIVGNAYSDAIDKFKNHYDDAMAIKFGPNGEPLVSTTESQVGKYADIDGDGTVDGIIFADLAVGGNGIWNDYDTTAGWANTQGTYVIPTVSSTKAYYVSQKSYSNKLGGTAKVLTPLGTGKDRFYIMSLSNLSGAYDWYNAAKGIMNDYATTTSQEFGKGKDNTATMIIKWETKIYGNQNAGAHHKDIWGQIKSQVNNGWFVPSRQEWAAFAGQLGITKSNYSSKGLSIWYWSSSQYNSNSAYYINCGYVDNSGCVNNSGYIGNSDTTNGSYVRLATTF